MCTKPTSRQANYPGVAALICLLIGACAQLADHLLRVVGPEALRGTGVRLVKVTLHETENGIAEASL